MVYKKKKIFKTGIYQLDLDTPRQQGAQWLSGRVLDSRPKGRGFEPHRCHCVVSLSKNINPSLVLVQPRKTRPFITERLLMGRKESNQTKTPRQRSLVFCRFGRIILVKGRLLSHIVGFIFLRLFPVHENDGHEIA